MKEIVLILLGIFLILPKVVWGCPVCAATRNDASVEQTLMMVGFLWLVPILLAGWVALRISEIIRKGKSHASP